MRSARSGRRAMRAVLFLVAASAAATACSNDILGDDPNTGIDLTVVKGPIQPVVREGEDNTAPVEDAKVEFRRLDGGRHTARTNALGEARVSLLPGTYVVTVLECPLTLALPDPDTVEVVSGQRQVLRQECDTGIR